MRGKAELITSVALHLCKVEVGVIIVGLVGNNEKVTQRPLFCVWFELCTTGLLLIDEYQIPRRIAYGYRGTPSEHCGA